MVQVPAISNWAVVPDTVQTVVVSEAKLTGNWELADAVRLIEMPAAWLAMGPKVIVWLRALPKLAVTLCGSFMVTVVEALFEFATLPVQFEKMYPVLGEAVKFTNVPAE